MNYKECQYFVELQSTDQNGKVTLIEKTFKDSSFMKIKKEAHRFYNKELKRLKNAQDTFNVKGKLGFVDLIKFEGKPPLVVKLFGYKLDRKERLKREISKLLEDLYYTIADYNTSMENQKPKIAA